MKIDGAIAIITGGAGGVGRAFCKALLENGAATVIILDISKDEGEPVQKQFQSQYGPGSVKFIQCDVTNKEELERAFRQTITDHGKLDIVCNNAGIFDESSLERTVNINLVAVMRGTFLALEFMKSGIIVNTASISGLYPVSSIPVYSASKHGIVGFTRSMATMSIHKGIRINCVCPDVVDTAMMKVGLEHPGLREIIQTKTLLKPEFVAKGLIQLIDDDTKNGEAMVIDQENGFTYHQFTTQVL